MCMRCGKVGAGENKKKKSKIKARGRGHLNRDYAFGRKEDGKTPSRLYRVLDAGERSGYAEELLPWMISPPVYFFVIFFVVFLGLEPGLNVGKISILFLSIFIFTFMTWIIIPSRSERGPLERERQSSWLPYL